MAGKLSPAAQVRLAALRDLSHRVQHVHGLVEQYAAAKQGHDQLAHSIKRAFARLKLAFMGAGLDQMSQLAGGMEVAAGRTASQKTKTRILREGVGSLKFQLDLAERAVISEDEASRKEKEKGAGAGL